MDKNHREKADEPARPDAKRKQTRPEPHETSNAPYGKEEHMNEELAKRIEEGREPS